MKIKLISVKFNDLIYFVVFNPIEIFIQIYIIHKMSFNRLEINEIIKELE